jgi:hypothetical protein
MRWRYWHNELGSGAVVRGKFLSGEQGGLVGDGGGEDEGVRFA